MTLRRQWIQQVLQSTVGLAVAPLLGAQAKNWTPQFLSAQQNDTLTAVGERILPGSAAARCNRLIDLFMTVESDDHRRALTAAIAEFEGKQFRSLTPEQQDAILTAASTPRPAPDSAFAVIKEWMADAYWSSREGMLELGWDQRVAWTSYPACGHAEAGH